MTPIDYELARHRAQMDADRRALAPLARTIHVVLLVALGCLAALVVALTVGCVVGLVRALSAP